MENNETPQTGRGFAGKLADPEVRRTRAQSAAVASAAGRKPEGMALKLIDKVQEISPDTRRALMAALVAAEGLAAHTALCQHIEQAKQ